MGTPDSFNGILLHIGCPACNFYKIGDDVEIPDGIYCGYTGFVVISGGKLVFTSSVIYDTDGRPMIRAEDLLNEGFPAKKARSK
ncbi:MAG: hypothetical protein ACOZAL_00900 [Patescibacteria group bacterium]